MTVRAAGNNNDPPAVVAPTGLEFQIMDITDVHSSCYFVKRKWLKTFRTIKIRI